VFLFPFHKNECDKSTAMHAPQKRIIIEKNKKPNKNTKQPNHEHRQTRACLHCLKQRIARNKRINVQK
jgi:hypothetical protein